MANRIYITILALAALWHVSVVPGLSQKNLSVLGETDHITIPFQYSQGFIVVDVTFHHIFQMKFILDTGAEHSILLDKSSVELMNVPYEKEVKILGADISYGLKAWVIRNMSIQFVEGKKIKQDMIVLDQDVMNLGAITGIKVDGILGAEFLKHFIVDIDYGRSEIKLFHPDVKKSKWKKYEHVEMENYFNKPYLRTDIGLTSVSPLQPNLLLLDTGAALSLLLHLEKDSLQNLPSNIVQGVLGKGLGGDLMGYTGMVSCLEIGSNRYDNLIASFQAFDSLITRQDKVVRDGIIGNFLLDQFHVVFDFPSHKLYLKKRNTRNKPFRIDRSGIVVHAFGDDFSQFYIYQVLNDSPGMDSGFEEGDIIKKMGIWPASFLSLAKINRKLTSDRDSVRFTIERSGKKIKKTLYLKDIYQLK